MLLFKLERRGTGNSIISYDIAVGRIFSWFSAAVRKEEGRVDKYAAPDTEEHAFSSDPLE
jgi:hypothetical protein